MDVKKITWEMTKVDRECFLREVLTPYLPSSQVEEALSGTSIAMVVKKEIIDRIGRDQIKKRCFYAGGLSLGTSLYGVAGTMVLFPLDFAQFAYHAAKLSQELYYLYGTKHMFSCQSKNDLELLMVMLAGAGSAITITSTSLAVLGQKLYQSGCRKLSLKALSALPFVGGAIHGSMSAYSLYSLASEYCDKLQEMSEEQIQTTPRQFAKEIGQIIDVEYREAEEKIRQFCNLEKLRELYTYFEHGYIDEQTFQQMKLDL